MNKATRQYNTRQASRGAGRAPKNKDFLDESQIGDENSSVGTNVNRGRVKRVLSAGDEEVVRKKRKRQNVRSATTGIKSSGTRTKSEGAGSGLFDDSLYLEIIAAEKKEKERRKAEQKLKKKAENDRLKAVKSVMISTPNNQKRKNLKPARQALCINISPIKLNESTSNHSACKDQSLVDSILLMKQRERQRAAEMMTPEPSFIRETREYLALFNQKAANRKVKIDWPLENETSTDDKLTSNNNPAIVIIQPPPPPIEEEVVVHESSEQPSNVDDEDDVFVQQPEQQQEESLSIILSKRPSAQSAIDVGAESLEVPELPCEGSSLQIPEGTINESNSLCIPVLETSQEDVVENSKWESIAEKEEPIHDITKPRVVKFVEPLPEPSYPPSNADVSKVRLKPGKWRKSLIAWRKSHNLQKINTDRTRKFSALFPIKTDPATIRRFTLKLQQTLEKSALLEQSDEGSLHDLSLLDSSIECASFHESFLPKRKTSQRETSVFNRSSIFYGLSSQLIHVDVLSSLSARQIVLRRCGQQEPLPFNEIYSESKLPNCKKIGEGVYGEVFMYKPPNDVPIVLKIIPIEGELLVNGEQQKRFDEILSEIVISMELSGLRNDKENSTDGFVNVKSVACVKGAYPQHLLDEWEKFNDSTLKGSENDNPECFDEDQLYIVFELCNAGVDLEAFQFKNAEESYSIFLQIALTLAVAETKFEFEHRDLHWGNVLISRTAEKFVEYRIDGKVIQIQTHGVKATIIDYTLSRMVCDDAVLYDNLAKDEELFEQDAEGEYQFEIYRLMRDRVENDFRRFEPFTNLLWLHYLIDKLIDGARYRYTKSDRHKSALNKMMHLRDELLDDFQSASDYVKSLTV